MIALRWVEQSALRPTSLPTMVPSAQHSRSYFAFVRGEWGSAVTPFDYAIWGMVGGLAVQAESILSSIARGRTWPWLQDDQPTIGPYIFALLVRSGLGLALALTMGLSGQISGPAGAFGMGAVAPLVIQQIARRAQAISLDPLVKTELVDRGGGVDYHSDDSKIRKESRKDEEEAEG